MPIARARRTAILLLLVLLAGVPALALAPAVPGAVRLAGLSLLWWYAAVVVPVVAAGVAVLVLARARA
jgi:hypothetical protein